MNWTPDLVLAIACGFVAVCFGISMIIAAWRE